MKKRIAEILTVCLILVVFAWPTQVFAAQSEMIYYSDGSYTIITVQEDVPTTRATNYKSGKKDYNHYSASGILQWTATLSATFSYNGSSSTCTSVNSLNATIYDSNWSLHSKSSSKSGNTAIGNVTMRYSGLLGAKDIPITINFTCDKTGKLS